MKTELENRLAEAFAFMRIKPLRVERMTDNVYDAFGTDVEDGWYQLLYDMCKEIAEVIEAAEQPVHIVVEQIKEKYGTLRFYYHLEEDEPGIICTAGKVQEEIWQIVNKYEDKSEKICEICGGKGEMRTNLKWIKTLCDNCCAK